MTVTERDWKWQLAFHLKWFWKRERSDLNKRKALWILGDALWESNMMNGNSFRYKCSLYKKQILIHCSQCVNDSWQILRGLVKNTHPEEHYEPNLKLLTIGMTFFMSPFFTYNIFLVLLISWYDCIYHLFASFLNASSTMGSCTWQKWHFSFLQCS